MKRIQTIVLAVTLLLLPQTLWAITAKSTGSESDQKTSDRRDSTAQSEPYRSDDSDHAWSKEAKSAAVQKKSGGTLLDKLRREVLDSKKQSKPSYDQFRDANNDGIADKVTTKREATSEEAGQAAQPATEKAATAVPATVEMRGKSDSDSGSKPKEKPKTTARKKP